MVRQLGGCGWIGEHLNVLIGRLQTDADRARVMEGLGENKKKSQLAELVKKLSPRWFVARDAKSSKLSLLNPRWAMSYL